MFILIKFAKITLNDFELEEGKIYLKQSPSGKKSRQHTSESIIQVIKQSVNVLKGYYANIMKSETERYWPKDVYHEYSKGYLNIIDSSKYVLLKLNSFTIKFQLDMSLKMIVEESLFLL